jgi:hypothetical protein
MGTEIEKIQQAMRHAENVLPRVAAECVVKALLAAQHCAADESVIRFVDRVLALPDEERPA